MKAAIAALVALCLTGCASFGVSNQKPVIGFNTQLQADLDMFATSFLDSIQAESIAERREFCGYFYVGADGTVQATSPAKGTFASCSLTRALGPQNIIGNYHTHGAFGANYDNEVPSVNDFESTAQLGEVGYLSTPGGRIWRVDATGSFAEQVCGLGCVTSDPNFVPRNEGSVLRRYSLLQIALRTGVPRQDVILYLHGALHLPLL